MKTPKVAEEILETLSERRKATSNIPFERIVHVYAALKERRHVNSNTLAKELEVSARSVGRDIVFMRDRLQLPIDYDAVQHSYVYGGAR